jgi:hypothetical protein
MQGADDGISAPFFLWNGSVFFSSPRNNNKYFYRQKSGRFPAAGMFFFAAFLNPNPETPFDTVFPPNHQSVFHSSD